MGWPDHCNPGSSHASDVPPQESLRHIVADVAADRYRDQADPPVELLEFSDGAFDVLFDAAHERTILMHGLGCVFLKGA